MDFKETSLCSLGEYQSFLDFLKEFGVSQSRARKSFPKKLLSKTIKAKSEWQIPNEICNPYLISGNYKGCEPCEIGRGSHWIALSKPYNIHSHPLSYNEGDNLLSFLKETNRFEYLNCSKNTWDRGLLFRLDFETSGVVFFTSSEELLGKIRNKDYQEAQKAYLCIVEGKPQEQGELVHHLVTTGKKIKISPNGESSHLKFQNLYFDKEKNCSLLYVLLGEGRRHQIRVQFSEAGYPILGDKLYGGKAAQRMFLHAVHYKLKMDDLIIEAQDWEPLFFRDFLNLNSSLEMFRNKLSIS